MNDFALRAAAALFEHGHVPAHFAPAFVSRRRDHPHLYFLGRPPENILGAALTPHRTATSFTFTVSQAAALAARGMAWLPELEAHYEPAIIPAPGKE